MYRAGVWYAETISDPSSPVRLDKHSWFDSVSPARRHSMSNMNFELCENHGIRWEMFPSVPFGQLFFCPFGSVAKAPAVVTCVRPNLSVLWG